MKPIECFVHCPQAEALVERFGDGEIAGLSQVDQAGLLVVLAGYVYVRTTGTSMKLGEWHPVNPSAIEIFLPEEYDRTTEDISEALELLEGITVEQAVGVIAFLTQA